MAASAGEAAPARSGADILSDYLDRPDAIHRRAASLAIVRSAGGGGGGGDGRSIVDGGRDDRRARSSRRLSLSSWRRPLISRTPAAGDGETAADSRRYWFKSAAAAGDSGGKTKAAIWEWKPVRALARIGKRRAGCLFSVEVAAVRGMPAASMDGLRLAVTVRKSESLSSSAGGGVQTMPATVRGGGAEFEETLFIRCNLYFTGGADSGKPLKLEPRRFVVSVVPVEAPGIRLGAHTVDVSNLVLDSVHKSSEGRRVRWFEKSFPLSGKATGGELIVKFGFQLMDDVGLCLYTQPGTESDDVYSSPARARIHNKNSFSVSSTMAPKISASDSAISPSMRAYKKLIERLSVDEHGEAVRSSSLIPRKLADDEVSGDVPPEYEVVDKGVETVKEVVHYQAHRDVLKELDSIAEQIEAIEALMTTSGSGKKSPSPKTADQRLDADEEMVTVQFLRKLEVDDDGKGRKLKQPMSPPESEKKAPPPPVVLDLGIGIGTAVQTRDGGFLVSMNPFDLPLTSSDPPPKLAMQVSRPFVLPASAMAATGFDVLQKMAAAGGGGAEEIRNMVAKLGAMDNLTGKTPEQVGFEGIAAAVIGGRRTTEGASSSAARSVRLVRKLAAAVCHGRSERVATGIWTADDDPETIEEVIAFAIQKLEAMAVDALLIQAEMADDDAPFEVAAGDDAADARKVFDELISPDEWSESEHGSEGRVTVVAAIQLRDPSRRYEAVGAPMIAVVQSARMIGINGGGGRFKVRSLHVGGVQMRCSPAGGGGGGGGGGRRASWSAERQKLTAMQWSRLAHLIFAPGIAIARSLLHSYGD
uniref:C2 NT-type domain-containing protein n=1 Tax=Leersia perrieri TaxID=77586 RepID=A0A0D9XLZ0_9ORYZ